MSAPENNAPIPGAADYAITLIRQGREEGAAIVEAAHRYTASSEVVRSAVCAKLGIQPDPRAARMVSECAELLEKHGDYELGDL